MGSEITGKVDFVVASETYQTSFVVYGDLKGSQHRPVVIIHGGPGMAHRYMLRVFRPHADIWTQGGRPVVFYDQLGNGSSSLCIGAAQDFWKPELFLDQLDSLLRSLQISDDFDLLGHSWGGMLAGQYAATRAPQGLKHLIIVNAPASVELSVRGTNQLLSQYPAEFVDTIRKHEAEGTITAAEYLACCAQFHKEHFCTLDPWPQSLLASFQGVETNPTVRRTLMGPTEFDITGTMKNWTIVDDLHKIACPVLLVSAAQDVTQECAVLPFFTNVPKIKWVELQNSTHLAMYEEPKRYFEVILGFLNGAQAPEV